MDKDRILIHGIYNVRELKNVHFKPGITGRKMTLWGWWAIKENSTHNISC